MKRSIQYLVVLGAIAVTGVLAWLGFTYSGGAVPWGERFAKMVEGGVDGGGSLLQIGRGGFGGFLLAGPLRDDVWSFVLIVFLLVGISAGLYWWAGSSTEQ
ncbi:MAG: cobalamin transport operon protein [Halodesulfurarchaeum sp.]